MIVRGADLARTGEQLPMIRLWIEVDRARRADRRSSDADQGRLLVLPGGEAGMLTAWWHAVDGSEWC